MFTHHLTTRAGFGLSYIGGILTTNFDIFSKEYLLWERIIKKGELLQMWRNIENH